METQKELYDKAFYERNKSAKKLKSVDIVLEEVFKIIPQCYSAVDFGCGTGTWLKGLEKYNITDIRGYDGEWVDKSSLVINKECFFETDFDKPMKIGRKFDLAISIEVGEHLKESSADLLIENITRSADFVLFSAAIPYQGGDNHINEQWPEYWNDKFKRFEYICVDSLRKIFWNNYEVLDFHRQNILLYAAKSRIDELNISKTDVCFDNPPMALVTPDRYLRLIAIKNNILFFLLKRIVRKVLGKKVYTTLKNKVKSRHITGL